MYYRDKLRQKKSRTRRSFDTIVKAVATGVFIVSLLLNLIFLVTIVIMAAVLGVSKDKARGFEGYEKVYIEGGSLSPREGKGNEIAVIRVNGLITEYDTREGFFEYSENPVSAVTNRLNIIKNDRNIKGILLEIDSPGGTITASDILYHKILSFKEDTGIPIVALMKQVAASGGYYIASASEHIIAYPTAIVGSIGVIMANFNFKGLMDRYGVKYIIVKSGEHKGFLSPFGDVNEEEIFWLQGIVDQMLDQFVDAVDQGRKNLTREEVEELADGNIYIAKDALEKGLIDEIGYFEDAVRVLAQRAGIRAPYVVEYRRSRGLKDIIGKVSLNFIPASLIKDRFIDQSGFDHYGLYYLWDDILKVR